MKWKRLKDGTLKNPDATIMKNSNDSFMAIVSKNFKTEAEAKKWAKAVLDFEDTFTKLIIDHALREADLLKKLDAANQRDRA